jgi:hypothetical protein
MTMDDIASCMNVVKYYNPSMTDLYTAFVEEAGEIELNRDVVTAADELGTPIYETLTVHSIGLANCLHDYVYNVLHPFDSIMVRNTIREQVCRDVFGLEANF